MEKKFLPLGSVVMLKEAKKALMIIGYLPLPSGENQKMYDYTGCPYPEGLIDSKKMIVFNKEDIDYLIFVGMNTIETQNVLEKIEEIKKKKTNV